MIPPRMRQVQVRLAPAINLYTRKFMCRARENMQGFPVEESLEREGVGTVVGTVVGQARAVKMQDGWRPGQRSWTVGSIDF